MHARLRTISRAILTISLAVGLCGCGTSVNVSAPGQAKGPVMSIGVPADEPGVGWYHDGEYSGLSVEVAKYVAKVLGYGDEQLFFHSQTPATRLDRLDDGSVDFAMVTFAYDGGKNALEMDHTQTADGTRYEVSGPYLVARNQLLVRADDARRLPDVQSLDGRTVCTVAGEYSGEQLHDRHPRIKILQRADYSECSASLLVGQSDAIAGPQPILAGLRKDGGTRYLHLQEDSYGTQAFGIPVKADQRKLMELIDTALQQMVDDGAWDAQIDAMETELGMHVDLSLNPVTVARSQDDE